MTATRATGSFSSRPEFVPHSPSLSFDRTLSHALSSVLFYFTGNEVTQMIDPAVEQSFSLTCAATTVPRRRGGKKTHPSTIFRWASRGLKGVVLETIQIGGTKCTSMEALNRFYCRLSALNQDGPSRPETPRQQSCRRQREIAAAERQLESEGL